MWGCWPVGLLNQLHFGVPSVLVAADCLPAAAVHGPNGDHAVRRSARDLIRLDANAALNLRLTSAFRNIPLQRNEIHYWKRLSNCAILQPTCSLFRRIPKLVSHSLESSLCKFFLLLLSMKCNLDFLWCADWLTDRPGLSLESFSTGITAVYTKSLPDVAPGR